MSFVPGRSARAGRLLRVLLAGSLASVAVAHDARAQSEPSTAPSPAPSPAYDARWPASADDEAERLGRFLDAERAAELRQYWAVAVGGLAVGVPQIVLGATMLDRSDVAAQAIGPGMIIGGAVDCLLGLGPLLAPTPMSILRGVYDDDRREGKPASWVVSDVEGTWRALVARQRAARLVTGIFDLVVGIPAFATGLVFALAQPGLAGMSSQTQYGWAGALVGFDFAIYQGVAALVAPPPVDTAFDTYELLKHGTSPGAAPSVSIIPVHGGGAMALGLRF